MLVKDLQSIGFPKNLAHVYLALAEFGGQAKAGEIIKKTDLHRNIVYGCLDKLINKQLVTKIEERGVASYKLLDTARLMNEVRQREQLTLNIIEELDTLKKHPQTQEVIVHEGLEGFRNFSFSTLEKLNQGEVIYVIGSIGDTWYKCMGKENYEKYKQIQTKKQIRWDMVLYANSEMDSKLAKENPDLCQIKLVPQNNKNPASVIIFGDTIGLQIFTDPISVIEIKNKALAQVYLNHFNYLWTQEVQTYHGLKEIAGILEYNLSEGYTQDVLGAGYGYGSKQQIEHITKFYTNYSQRTAYLKPKRRLIFFEQFKSDAENEINQRDNNTKKNTQIRFLPSQYYTPMQTHIFSDKVLLIFWFDEPIATVYTNPEIIEAYKKQFAFLWDTAKILP